MSPAAGAVRVVCRPPVAAGFELAGLPATVVSPGDDPRPVLSALAGHPALAVILVEEAVYDAMPPESRLPFDRSTRPVVVPFPSPAWGPPRVAEERVIELLRRAIGYRVRLK